MNCKQVNKLMVDYIDGNLTETARNNVKNHLDTCLECALLYQKVSKSLELLKSTSEIPEQPFYYTRLMQRMENKKVKSKHSVFEQIFSKRILQALTYLVSILVAVYIGILIGSNSPANNQYSDIKSNNNTPLETFAENNYLNGLEIETLENIIIEE